MRLLTLFEDGKPRNREEDWSVADVRAEYAEFFDAEAGCAGAAD